MTDDAKKYINGIINAASHIRAEDPGIDNVTRKRIQDIINLGKAALKTAQPCDKCGRTG